MDVHEGRTPLYREEQRFRDTWLGYLLMVPGALLTAVTGYVLVKQLVFGTPVGQRPAPDAVLALIGALLLCVGVALVYVGLAGRLVTEVHADGLAVHLIPLTRRHFFPYDQIESCDARRYRPIIEYGGWGVRWGPSGKAYNVSGNDGVQLTFKDGKGLLVGSRDGEALARAVREARG